MSPMSEDGHHVLSGAVRRLLLGVERAATSEATESALRSAIEELRRELEDDDAVWAEVLRQVVALSMGALEEGLRGRATGAGRALEFASAASTRGALDELERQWKQGGLPLHGLAKRLDSLLDGVLRTTSARERLLDPERVHALGFQAGRGLLEGALAGVRDHEKDLGRMTSRAADLGTTSSLRAAGASLRALIRHPLGAALGVLVISALLARR